MCFTVELSGARESPRKKIMKRFLAAMRLRETPVPIPNTTVKTQAADGTALETVWESRRLPDQKITEGIPIPYRVRWFYQ